MSSNSDNSSQPRKELGPIGIVFKEIQAELKAEGIHVTTPIIAHRLEISSSTLWRWLGGDNQPHKMKLAAFAQALASGNSEREMSYYNRLLFAAGFPIPDSEIPQVAVSLSAIHTSVIDCGGDCLVIIAHRGSASDAIIKASVAGQLADNGLSIAQQLPTNVQDVFNEFAGLYLKSDKKPSRGSATVQIELLQAKS